MHSWDPERFQRAVRALLDVTGMSQAQLADLARISPSQASRWARGQNRPDHDSLIGFISAVDASFSGPRVRELTAELLQSAGYGGSQTPDADPDGAPVGDPLAGLPRDPDERLTELVRRQGMIQDEMKRLLAGDRSEGEQTG